MTTAFIQGIGPLELAIVAVVLLLLFGSKRISGLGRTLGGEMRQFKESVTGHADSKFGDEDESGAKQAPAALGSPADGEEQPLDGEVTRERR